MNQARFTKHARSELLGQTAYYEAIEKGLGSRFRSEVEAAAQRAAAYPLHGKPSAGGTRQRLVTDFPFSVVYTETEWQTELPLSPQHHGVVSVVACRAQGMRTAKLQTVIQGRVYGSGP